MTLFGQKSDTERHIYPLLGVNPFNLDGQLGVYKYLQFNIEVGH